VESHSRYRELLESIQLFFKTGSIIKSSYRETYQYRVKSREGLDIIIKHFYHYPLLTSKRQDFYLFSLLYDMICKKVPSTQEGFLHCLAIINNINKPINLDKLLYFTNIYDKLPELILPPVTLSNCSLLIFKPWWIVGFSCGEGSFTYYTKKYIGKSLVEK